MSPVAINGVDKQGVYVNGVQVKQALDAANETVAKGIYDATTLSAIDADLAEANIKDGETIFGKVGTLAAGTIAHDDQDKDIDNQSHGPHSFDAVYELAQTSGFSDKTLFTITLTCAQATVLEAVYFAAVVMSSMESANAVKLQLYIDGVAQGETGFIPNDDTFHTFSDMGNGAVSSGDRIVYVNIHNYITTSETLSVLGGVFAGCCKL